MKILFLHSSSDLYGASKILIDTIRACVREGYKCKVILSERGPLSDSLSKIGIDVLYFKLGILRRKYLHPLGLINRLFYIMRSTLLVRNIIKEEGYDIIYSNTSSVLTGAFASKFTSAKHIWHIHEIINRPMWFARFNAYNLKSFSDLNIYVSSATMNHWMKINPSLKNRNNKVVYNGIKSSVKDTKILTELLSLTQEAPKETLWIGMIARVHFWKGQDYFLDIASELLTKFENVRFLMAGDAYLGYEYLNEQLEQKRLELGISGKVHDLGYVEEPYQFFKQLDIFILPSILPDPLPTTVLEAMISKVPVAATAHGGSIEMLDNGRVGLLIPWDDPKVAAQKIGELIENENLRMDLSRSANEFVTDNFNIDRYERDILESILSVNST